MRWNKDNQLEPYAAENCRWVASDLICQLKKDLKFEDGTAIVAQHFKNTLDLAKEGATQNSLDFKKINLRIEGKYKLIYSSETLKNSLFHSLTQIEMSPRKEKIFYPSAHSVISSTLYKIKTFKKNNYIVLEKKSSKIDEEKVLVKIRFIDDLDTAHRLFKLGHLSLLNMLPVREIESYRDSDQLLQVNMARMDGLFFNPKISLQTRKALSLALNYDDLQILYQSVGKPGCPSLPKNYYINRYCYDFNLEVSENFASVVKSSGKHLSYKLVFSSFGGDDIQKGMEWVARQWSKNLDVQIDISPQESGVYFSILRAKKFDIVRKGIPLDSPSCLEALTTFTSASPNNYWNYKNSEFDNVVSTIESDVNLDEEQKRIYCDRGLKILFEDYVYIPLGTMYFSFLTDNKFDGWWINSLNILNIEDLKPKKVVK